MNKLENYEWAIKMDKIIKAEKDEGGLYRVTFLNEKNERYTTHMTAIKYRIYIHKQTLEAEGCNMKTLQSFEELIREDAEEQRETERCYERLR